MDAQYESVQQAIRRIDKAGYYLTPPKAILCFLRGDIEHQNMRLNRTPANRDRGLTSVRAALTVLASEFHGKRSKHTRLTANNSLLNFPTRVGDQ